jgi:CRP/FNR family transcriptional regulator, cyclic AMP receptor protein
MNHKSILQVKKGSIFIMANTPNPGYVYILKSGEIAIDSVFQFQNKSINFYSAGDTFGYVSAITKNNHSSTLTTTTDCIIIKLSIESFFDYLKKNPDTYLKILKKLSEKLQIFIDYIDPYKTNSLVSIEEPEKILENVKSYVQNNQTRLACFALSKYIRTDFSKEKNKEKLEQAKKDLQSIDSRYSLPSYLEYTNEEDFLVKKNDILFVENEKEDDFFYRVESGSVKISKLLNGKEIILGICTKGEFFGEMAILNKRFRSATATAFNDSKIKRYTSSSILERADKDLLFEIFRLISRRLWFAYHRVFMLKVTDPNVKLYIQLQMLIADEITKSEVHEIKDKYIFRFSLNELLKMVDSESIDSEKISEFLNDKNLSFHNGQLVVKDKKELDLKVDTIKKKQIRLMKQIIL